MEPRCVGSYVLDEQVGSGGMGVVYRARCLVSGRVMALKLLPKDVEPTCLKRFEREMEVLRSLRHPHIVQCYGGLCDNEQRYYAMEFVEHGTVADLLQRRGQLNWDEAVDYALQVCSALEYMHERGIVHRDLKPGNLLIGSDGQLKLSDFGVAWIVDGQHLTREGKTVGSFAYMSPEQINGSDNLSSSSDLYALGCVLFEMIAGRRVFGAKTGPPVLLDHLRTKPPEVRRFAPHCPMQLANLIAQLLEKSAECRPKDAQAVIQVLEDARTAPQFDHHHLPRTEVVSVPRRQPTITERAVQLWHKLPAVRRKWIAATGLVLLGVTIGLGLRSVLSQSPSATPVAQSNASQVDSKRALPEPPPESRSRPSIWLFLLTMSVLAGLAAYLRKLNREEEEEQEENAQEVSQNVALGRSPVPRDGRQAQHYFDHLRSSNHLH